jgi:hypothetical protein
MRCKRCGHDQNVHTRRRRWQCSDCRRRQPGLHDQVCVLHGRIDDIEKLTQIIRYLDKRWPSRAGAPLTIGEEAVPDPHIAVAKARLQDIADITKLAKDYQSMVKHARDLAKANRELKAHASKNALEDAFGNGYKDQTEAYEPESDGDGIVTATVSDQEEAPISSDLDGVHLPQDKEGVPISVNGETPTQAVSAPDTLQLTFIAPKDGVQEHYLGLEIGPPYCWIHNRPPNVPDWARHYLEAVKEEDEQVPPVANGGYRDIIGEVGAPNSAAAALVADSSSGKGPDWVSPTIGMFLMASPLAYGLYDKWKQKNFPQKSLKDPRTDNEWSVL